MARKLCWILVQTALASVAALNAQQYRATISGTVTDPQGAAIAKIQVVATETRTGVKTSAVSEARTR